jgi:TonB family protein
MSSESKTAFFSYCREDSDFALKLAADLKSAGADVWIDQLDIEPGAPWDRAVEDALNSAPRMLVLLSPVSVASDNVRDEVSFALSRQKRVIPVLYRDCDVPFRLARLQHIDFRPDYARALNILLRALKAVESAALHPGASPGEGHGAVVAEPEDAAAQHAHAEESERARAAAERARLAREEEHRLASEKALAEQEERERRETEAQARQEKSRAEQRAAEQARLEEEARQAAERARLAEEERARKEAELKARQEQLRREEQESSARRLDLARLEHEQREREKAQAEARAKAAAAATATPAAAVARKEAPPIRETQPAPSTSSSLRYIVIAAVALVLIIGSIVFFATRTKPQATTVATQQNAPGETTTSTTTGQPSPPASPAPGSTSSSGNAPASRSEDTSGKTSTSAPPPSSTADQPNAPSSGGTSGEHAKSSRLKTAPSAAMAAKVASAPVSVRDSSGAPTRVQLPAEVSKAFLEREVVPTYPPLAAQARIHGVVVLQVVIDKNGVVQGIKTVSGHPLLVPAAVDAVKQWRYRPFVVNDKPVEVDTTVTVNFAIANK